MSHPSLSSPFIIYSCFMTNSQKDLSHLSIKISHVPSPLLPAACFARYLHLKQEMSGKAAQQITWHVRAMGIIFFGENKSRHAVVAGEVLMVFLWCLICTRRLLFKQNNCECISYVKCHQLISNRLFCVVHLLFWRAYKNQDLNNNWLGKTQHSLSVQL